MQNAQAKQFRLNGEGQIQYQPNPSNPLPGSPIAVISKGASSLEPKVELLDSCPAEDKAVAQTILENWLKTHIATVLEPLVALKNDETLQRPVAEIAAAVFAAMGTLPREQIETSIEKLDQETRRVLRAKKIRLGPILVFQPDLNKPAAVHLRALLWTLFNDKPLPAPVPPDGVVSFKVDAATADAGFYQAVGYPVFATRAIRIDMLDRVISAVYDSAEKGQFKAKHQMAEWLGCPIDDLYQILIAMGHTKISEPPAAEEKPKEEPAADAAPAEAKPQVKPELATFRLKRGKAFEKEKPRPPRQPKPEQRKRPEKKPAKGKKEERPERIMSAGPKARPEDSPFAILQQLKVKKDDSGKA